MLGLPGEETYALAPLPGGEAGELFVRRAGAAKHDFVLTAEDRAAIAPLVKLLDGLPLAIELAAARVRVMPPRTLLERMDERFRLLASSGGRRDRHATLRATLDWSWELLSDAEKSALAQLSVFEDRFTREAVEAVIDLSACDGAPWAVDVLQSLVDKSLVRPLRRERFEMIGSVQAYAAGQLVGDGRFPGSGASARQAAHERHCAWFAALGPRRAVEDACADLANLVAACQRAIASSQGRLAADALEGAWVALSLRGPFSAGVELAEAVCAMPVPDAAAARAHSAAASALDSVGRTADARRHYETALRLARGCDDHSCQAAVLTRLAAIASHEGRMAEARSALVDALALARRLGDAVGECGALNGLANLDFDHGRLDDARGNYEAALARARDAGDLGRQCALLGNLGMLYANIGRIEEARRCLEQSLALARQLGDRQREGNNLCNLGMLDLVQKRPQEAIDVSRQALQVARELGDPRLEGVVQCNLGLAQEECGRTQEALACFEAALVAMRALGDRRSEGQFLGYLGRARARLREFEAARECFASGEARLREIADTLSLGVLLCDRAECEWHSGDAARAREVAGEANAIATAAGAGPQSELGQALARLADLLGAPPPGTSTSS